MLGHKCSFDNGVIVKPDGIHELDPCIYIEMQRYHNVDVSVRECEKCGAIDITWTTNKDTEVVYEDKDFTRRNAWVSD